MAIRLLQIEHLVLFICVCFASLCLWVRGNHTRPQAGGGSTVKFSLNIVICTLPIIVIIISSSSSCCGLHFSDFFNRFWSWMSCPWPIFFNRSSFPHCLPGQCSPSPIWLHMQPTPVNNQVSFQLSLPRCAKNTPETHYWLLGVKKTLCNRRHEVSIHSHDFPCMKKTGKTRPHRAGKRKTKGRKICVILSTAFTTTICSDNHRSVKFSDLIPVSLPCIRTGRISLE